LAGVYFFNYIAVTVKSLPLKKPESRKQNNKVIQFCRFVLVTFKII
jgi:hypothetical protein